MQRRRSSLFLVLCLAACGPLRAQAESLYRGEHKAMGTTWTILAYARDADAGQGALDAAFDEVDRVDTLLSNYKPESELSRINREAGAGPVTTDPETFAFLQIAMHQSEISSGAFDMTVGRLLRTWGFFDHDGKLPTAAERAADAASVGWRHLRLDPTNRTVQFVDSRALELDPGSIGKGYAVDRVVATLTALGISRAFLSAGSSSVYAIGAPPGKDGWTVDIPDPHHQGHLLGTVLLRDRSLSTGACTEKFFLQAGHRYCHIFDPRTLLPVEGMLQTSVIAPLAIDSDALGTSVFVLTPDQSARMLEKMPGVSALIITNTEIRAIRWPGKVQATVSGAPPTGEVQ